MPRDKERDERRRRSMRRFKRSDLTVAEVAHLEGVPPSTLHAWLRADGCEMRERGWTRRVTTDEDREIVNDAANGVRIAETAERLGRSTSTISRARTRLGVTSRATNTKAPRGKTRWYDEAGEVTAKWCPACQRKRARKFWGENANSRDGLQSQCKSCAKARRAA